MAYIERQSMRTLYVEPLTEKLLLEKASQEVGEEVRHCQRISSSHRKHPYAIQSETDVEYLQHARKLVTDVGDFVRSRLPWFLSRERANFDYVRTHQLEFLERHEMLVKVKAETSGGDEMLRLCFELPSSVFIPEVLLRIKGQYLYIYDHLQCRISFVIGRPENPKIDAYVIQDAMEEFWHLALCPHLIERLNRNLRSGAIEFSDYTVSRILVMEGELVSKGFSLASFGEFTRETGYDVPLSKPKGRERLVLDKIQRLGIKKALRVVRKLEGLEIWEKREDRQKGNAE
jgi:hypothetical protein